ncbi:MAG: hypothetical protein K2K77_07440 [Duncaniella sp.]|nr:hypothetical protein [Duncaniella sp.]
MKHILSAVLTLLVTALTATGGTPHVYTNPAGSEFPILGWSSIRGMENQTPERYREMRECGFNLALPLTDSISEIVAALNASRGTGISIIGGAEELYTAPEATVALIKGHPNLAGYFIKDEPKYHQYPDLARLVGRIRGADDSRLLYMNLFPTYARGEIAAIDDYDEYVDCYLRMLGTGFLSYDHYSITCDSLGNAVQTPDYYENLEIISRHAREAGVPFWAFALATAHYSFPNATRAHLRHQMLCNLAYGAQGVQYFTYWQFPGLGDSQDVPITNDGRRGTVWWHIRDLNREIQALAPVFLGCEVVDVAHTGDSIPVGTHRLTQLPEPIKSVTSLTGEGLLVSHLRNGEYDYLMIVTRDLNRNQQVEVIADDSVEFIVAGDAPLSAAAVSPRQWLAPGDYLLYRWRH